MARILPRLLVMVSAVILFVGGLMHGLAYDKTVAALADSNIAAFYSASLKGLWLIDSATLVTLSVICALVVLQPAWAARPVICALAIIPAGTAFFLYRFIGPFLPAHMLAASAVALVLGGAAWKSSADDIKRGAR